jgi:ABC-2 type transport system permease protein
MSGVTSTVSASAVSDLRRDVRLVLRQVGYEQRSYWRNPTAAVFTFALPVVFLFVFAGTVGHYRVPHLHGVLFEQYYVPAILTYGMIAACFTNLATNMTFRRDQGILKRVRGTPIPAGVYLAGVVGNAMVVSVLLAVVTVGAGVALFHVPAPHHVAAILVDLLVGGASFCALGLAVTAVIPNADAAPPMINIVMLALTFISGTFFYVDPSSGLGQVASVFPVAHLVRAMLGAVVPGSGHPVWAWRELAVVAAWGVGGLVFAIRRFKWESAKH